MSAAKSFVTMQEFMDLAIQFEVESAGFYRQMAATLIDREGASEAAADADVIELLAQLETQEREHERILRGFSVATDSETTLQFAPELALSMPSPPGNPGFDEMLEVAIEREHRSAEIYRAASTRTVGDFREMIGGLAGFEDEHEDRLKRLQARRA